MGEIANLRARALQSGDESGAAMIEIWLGMSNSAMAGVAAAVLFGFAGLLHWASFRGPLAAFAQRYRGVVAPFFTSVAVLFSLLFGFLANDVWERNRRGHRAVAVEHEALVTVHALGRVTGASAALDEAVRAYVDAAVMKEWTAMARQQAAPEAGQALDILLVGSGQVGDACGVPVDVELEVKRAHAPKEEGLFTGDAPRVLVLPLALCEQRAKRLVVDRHVSQLCRASGGGQAHAKR